MNRVKLLKPNSGDSNDLYRIKNIKPIVLLMQ